MIRFPTTDGWFARCIFAHVRQQRGLCSTQPCGDRLIAALNFSNVFIDVLMTILLSLSRISSILQPPKSPSKVQILSSVWSKGFSLSLCLHVGTWHLHQATITSVGPIILRVVSLLTTVSSRCEIWLAPIIAVSSRQQKHRGPLHSVRHLALAAEMQSHGRIALSFLHAQQRKLSPIPWSWPSAEENPKHPDAESSRDKSIQVLATTNEPYCMITIDVEPSKSSIMVGFQGHPKIMLAATLKHVSQSTRPFQIRSVNRHWRPAFRFLRLTSPATYEAPNPSAIVCARRASKASRAVSLKHPFLPSTILQFRSQLVQGQRGLILSKKINSDWKASYDIAERFVSRAALGKNRLSLMCRHGRQGDGWIHMWFSASCRISCALK